VPTVSCIPMVFPALYRSLALFSIPWMTLVSTSGAIGGGGLEVEPLLAFSVWLSSSVFSALTSDFKGSFVPCRSPQRAAHCCCLDLRQMSSQLLYSWCSLSRRR